MMQYHLNQTAINLSNIAPYNIFTKKVEFYTALFVPENEDFTTIFQVVKSPYRSFVILVNTQALETETFLDVI